ncbi:transcription initiation factor TFIID subunit 12 [Euwallacea fornicatus]|uniref:transcription initiation factor TFIID subunit 12 n=1 Tax=Euwallacea fornicatus TaxID=995702 RepID=UPI00338E2CF1
MQNNFQPQNIIVNQPVGQLITQNNGITTVTNTLTQENQIMHNNIVEPQAIQVRNPPVQNIQQVPPAQHIHSQSATLLGKQTVNATSETAQVVTKQRLQDLVREIDQTLTLEDDVEEILLSYVDEFVDRCLNGAALIARNRRCNSIEVKDVQQFLSRNYNMWTPGFGTDELRPYKRSLTTEAHKQRTALIRKTLKKY